MSLQMQNIIYVVDVTASAKDVTDVSAIQWLSTTQLPGTTDELYDRSKKKECTIER